MVLQAVLVDARAEGCVSGVGELNPADENVHVLCEAHGASLFFMVDEVISRSGNRNFNLLGGGIVQDTVGDVFSETHPGGDAWCASSEVLVI